MSSKQLSIKIHSPCLHQTHIELSLVGEADIYLSNNLRIYVYLFLRECKQVRDREGGAEDPKPALH